MGILLEVGFGHLATHDVQRLVVVNILSGLAVIVNDEAYFQFLPCCENSLQGSLDTIEINVVGEGHDTWDVVLHHFRIFHAVIENAQLGLKQWVKFHIFLGLNVIIYYIRLYELFTASP